MKHEIKTIEDIFKVLTPDNFENFLKDFSAFVAFRIELEKKLDDIGAKQVALQKADTFTWFDDGKNDVSIKVELRVQE